MGTSTRPVLLILPTSENIFVPLLPFGPRLPVPLGAVVDDERHVGPGLHVVQVRRAFPQALLDRMDVLGPRPARLAFEGGHERARLAADEGPPPLAILTSKSKPEPKMSSPIKPYSLACSMAFLAFSTARGYSFLT